MNKYLPTHTLYTINKNFLQSVLSGLDWTGLASDPLNRTELDQDHRLTDLDWTGFFQMNPFHTLQFCLCRSLISSYGPCVSFLGVRTGKRNSSAGEHIHIFHRMLAFVSGADKSHIMPINFILVQTSHTEPSTITRRCFAYQFYLPI